MYDSITKKSRNAWLMDCHRKHPDFSMADLAKCHWANGYGQITRQGVCAALHREEKRQEAKNK